MQREGVKALPPYIYHRTCQFDLVVSELPNKVAQLRQAKYYNISKTNINKPKQVCLVFNEWVVIPKIIIRNLLNLKKDQQVIAGHLAARFTTTYLAYQLSDVIFRYK